MNFHKLFIPLQKIRINLYELCAFLIILASASLRLTLITLGWPVMNGDEAMMTVMAQHISEGKEHPIFYYGQYYLGTIEAYTGAVLFKFFGYSAWSMRLGSVLFYTGFLICMYFITSRIFTKSLALVVLLLLSLGSLFVFSYQISPVGYTELSFLCALLFLLSYILAASNPAYGRWLRSVGFLCWGILAGLLVWEQLVTVPYILVSGLLLLICCWRSLLKGSVVLVALGLIIGAWPLISFNLHAAPGTDSLHTFLSTSNLGSGNSYHWYDYITSTLFIILPASLGLFPQCYIRNVPFKPDSQVPHSHLCFALQATYGISYLILFLASAILIGIGLLIAWRVRVRSRNAETEEKPNLPRYYAQFLLLLGAGLTLVVFARNTTSVYAGVLGVRYIVCVAISLPAVLWPLWCLGSISRSPKLLQKTLLAFRFGILILLLAVSAKATLDIVHLVPETQTANTQRMQLVEKLEQMHITRFYSEYWTCNPLIAVSHEELICGDSWTSNDTLVHGYDRYYPYRLMVQGSANPGFVYPHGNSQIDVLTKLLKDSGISYQHISFEGYEIYQPSRPIPALMPGMINPGSTSSIGSSVT